tara:strand:- start:655 stop:888 length:234 start_codon:yes stop_codon:yes gene_type:complete
MSETEKGFNAGYEIGLNALDQCDETGKDNKDVLAGLMSVVMHAAYAMAPSEELAEELITWAQQNALEDWENEKKEQG